MVKRGTDVLYMTKIIIFDMEFSILDSSITNFLCTIKK